MNVLVVEDDPKIAEFLRNGLEADGHRAEVSHGGDATLPLALSGRYDLVLLDLTLPGVDGMDILREIRRSLPTLPVIVLTARGSVEERVEGLEIGADDYLVKPFSFAELMARVRAIFRRSSSQRLERVLRVGALELDRIERTATLRGVEVELSSREARLLEFLMRNPGEPLSRAMIADRVWGHQFDTGTNVIDVYVNYLRKKLKELGSEPIRTLRGVGYVFDPPDARAAEPGP